MLNRIAVKSLFILSVYQMSRQQHATMTPMKKKLTPKQMHQQGMFFNYNSHLDDAIDSLSKKYLGNYGIVGIADGIWDSGPVPGRPQGGPFSTVIFVYTTKPDLAKVLVQTKLLPKQFQGYRILIEKSGKINALGIYGKGV
jgi:hypothetical protein